MATDDAAAVPLTPAEPPGRTLRLRDLPGALVAPRRAFSRVEDVPGYGWPLAVLLFAMTLAGYAVVQTGLVDREVEAIVQRDIAEIEKQGLDVVERSVLRKRIEDAREGAEFLKLIYRMEAIVARPVGALAGILLLAALCYAIVAMRGRRPEWSTLLTIVIAASYTDLLRHAVHLGMMLHFGSIEVDTSLAPLAMLMRQSGGVPDEVVVLVAGVLTAFDPFRLWFWWVVGRGLSTTRQLRGWKMWALCVVLWTGGAAIRTGLLMQTLQAKGMS
jgi:hypothetical protein